MGGGGGNSVNPLKNRGGGHKTFYPVLRERCSKSFGPAIFPLIF